MLKVCREKLKDFSQAEIINSHVSDVNLLLVDLIITIGVWEYIDPQILFKKIKEITHIGSKVIVVFPNIYNKLNMARTLGRMSPFGRSPEGRKIIGLRPGFVRKIFKNDFTIIESASFGMVSWFPKKIQFLILPLWKFADLVWGPFQRSLPAGINIYYLFERK